MPRVVRLLLAFITGVAIAPRALAAQGGPGRPAVPAYHIVKRIPIPGEGGWDYLTIDPVARRLYVSHATRVVVLDADADTIVGEIPNTMGVHGVALAPDLGRGFTSNGRDSSVTIFDARTLAVIANVKVTGRNPDAIVYDSATHRVFTFNGGSDNATALDARTGAVVGTIPLGGRPEFSTVDGAGRLWVNLEDKSSVVRVNTRALTAGAPWPLAPCEEPSGMAIDRASHRLFIGCSNKLMAVVDAESGRVVTTLPIGDGVDANAFDPATKLAYSSNGDGTLTIVHEDGADRYSVVANVLTAARARTMALDGKTGRVFLPTAQFTPAPAQTAATPRLRPAMVPGTFVVLVLEP